MSNTKHWAQSDGEADPRSPEGVKPISLEALNSLGVDGEGNLYWIDTKILTAKREFRLTFFQGALALVTAISAFAAAVATGVTAYVDWKSREIWQSQPTSQLSPDNRRPTRDLFFSASELIAECDSTDTSRRSECDTYIRAIYDARELLDPSQPADICLPIGIEPADIRGPVVASIKADESQEDYPAAIAVLNAFWDKFPCRKP